MRLLGALAGVIVVTCFAVACGTFGADFEDDPPSRPAPELPDSGQASAPRGLASDLVTGEKLPRDIVVDPSNVYWLCEPQGDGGVIRTVPKKPSPGPATVFADGAEVSRYEAASIRLAGDTSALYWAAGPAVMRKAKVGGQPPIGVVWLGQDSQAGACQGLVVDPGKAYVATSGHGGRVIGTDTAASQDAQFIVSDGVGADVKVVTVDATDVYVGRNGQITKLTKGGGDASAPIVFAITDGPVQAIVNDDTAVYWVDASRVRKLAKVNVGGTPADSATAQYNPSAIALDEASIYWTNAGDGFVRTVPKSGGTPETLSKDEAQPTAIAVDTTGIFWTNYADGRVRVIWR